MKLFNQVSNGLIRVILLAGLAVLIGCAGGTEGTRTKTANVQVLTADGDAAPNVTISSLALDGTELNSSKTDAKGQASVRIEPLNVVLEFSSTDFGIQDRVELGAAGQEVEQINLTVQQDIGAPTVSVKEISVELSETPADPAVNTTEEDTNIGGVVDQNSAGSHPTRPKPSPNDSADPISPDVANDNNGGSGSGTNTNTTPSSSNQPSGGSSNYNASGSSSTPSGGSAGGGSGSGTITDPAGGGSSSGSITDPAGSNGNRGDPSRGDRTGPSRDSDTGANGTRGR